jgi:hypothetical protein
MLCFPEMCLQNLKPQPHQVNFWEYEICTRPVSFWTPRHRARHRATRHRATKAREGPATQGPGLAASELENQSVWFF